MEPAAGAAPAWGIAAVGADTSPFTGAGVTVVAVLDTGIDAAHPAFAASSSSQQDFTGEGDGDRNGHGTHCAGTIFGRDVDGQRIGVARGVPSALIGKVLGDDGGGDSDMIFAAIQWAVESGANVISMSLGFDFPGMVRAARSAGWPRRPRDVARARGLPRQPPAVRRADATRAGARGVRRATRSSSPPPATRAGGGQRPTTRSPRRCPAAAEGVVSVGALGRRRDRFDIAPFSNTFPVVAGPGVEILSAKRRRRAKAS